MGMTSKIIKRLDKALILSDSLICSVLSIEAEALGVTLEEYVDRFLDVFYDNSIKLDAIVKDVGW